MPIIVGNDTDPDMARLVVDAAGYAFMGVMGVGFVVYLIDVISRFIKE